MVKTHLEVGNMSDEDVFMEEPESVEEENDENVNNNVMAENGEVPVDENDVSVNQSVDTATKQRFAPTNDTDYTTEQSYDFSPKNIQKRKTNLSNTIKYTYNPQENTSNVFVDNSRRVYKPKTNIYVSEAFTTYAIQYLKFLKYMLKETMRDE